MFIPSNLHFVHGIYLYAQVYQLAMERKKQLDAIQEDGYHMPDSYDGPGNHNSRFDVAKQRYAEPEDPEQANPFAEQEKWEAEQMRRHMKVKKHGPLLHRLQLNQNAFCLSYFCLSYETYQ